LVAQGLAERRAQRERGVLDGVVGVDVQVALSLDGQVEQPVLAELRQHVVEEPDPGGHVHHARAVEVDLDLDGRLLRRALDAAYAAHRTPSRAARKAAISSPVPIDTRSHSGGPTSRMSTPLASSASQTARRSGKRPNSTKFASESATVRPLPRSHSTVASRSRRSSSTVPSSSSRWRRATSAAVWVSVDRW